MRATDRIRHRRSNRTHKLFADRIAMWCRINRLAITKEINKDAIDTYSRIRIDAELAAFDRFEHCRLADTAVAQ